MSLIAFQNIKTIGFAVCHTCNLRHHISCSPTRFLAEFADWEHKHPLNRGCRTEFISMKREIPKNFNDTYYEEIGKNPWFLKYGENTNFNLSFRASSAITNAIASLATSSTWVAGYESDVIDNSTNKDLDVFISALITVGTTPTTGTLIEIDTVSALDDTPTWPDVFDGTTSAETVTSVGVKQGLCLPLGFLNVDSTTSNRGYYMTMRSVAAQYGGICPNKFVLFTTHNTGVNLNSTAGNHVFTQQGIYIVGA